MADRPKGDATDYDELCRIVNQICAHFEQPGALAKVTAQEATMFLDVFGCLVVGMNRLISANPQLLDEAPDEYLDVCCRFGSPFVRSAAERRLDARRSARAH